MQRATTTRGKRRVHHARAGLALSQLSAMLALAFTPGMQAQGASFTDSFTDSITFSTSGQSLWGGNAAADISSSIYLGTQWGTYAGASPVKSYTAGSISELRDPVFGISLGSYGLAAAFESSGRVGASFAPDLRGGLLSYTREVKPVLTLPKAFTANTLFSVSAIDSLNKAPVLNTSSVQISSIMTGTVDFDASVAATACFVTCTAPTSFDFKSYPLSRALYSPTWTPFLNGHGSAQATAHFDWSYYTNPFYLYKGSSSVAGISVDSRLLEVNLSTSYDLSLDVSVKAPVMTRIEFDKPVTELLANGDSILHADGVVSFALGSAVSLQFGDEAGKLVRRSYFLDSPSYTTQVSAEAGLGVGTKVGCAMAIKAVGLSLTPPQGAGNCASTSSETLAAPATSLYDREHNLTSVKASGTLNGVPFSEQQLTGVLAANQVVQNRGGGATSMVRDNLTLRALGARYENLEGAKTFVSGVLSVEERGTLLNSGGAELIIEAGGTLQNSFITGSPGEGAIQNLGGRITNRGSVLVQGSFKNTGVIDNYGSFTVTPTGFLFLDFAGGTFNNRAGATLTLGGMALLGTPVNPSVPHRGSFNLNPGSTVIAKGVGVGLGYRQVNEGAINVQPFTSFIISGELQVGNGGAHGTLSGQLSVLDTGILSFNRSDDTSFTGAVEGSGTVRKRGYNTLTMTAEQLFAGRTVVEGGRLVLMARNESGLFDIGFNSTLEMRVDEAERDSLWSFGTRFAGQGTLVKSGMGTLRWGASKAVFAMGAGAMIDVQGGTLVAGSSGNEDWSQNYARLNVAVGATLWGAEANVRVNGLSGGGRIQSGHANSSYQSFSFGVGNGGGTFSGVLADTDTGNGHIGRFVKEGAGHQILSGTNTFSGPLTIKNGTVTVGDGGTSGSLATTSIINSANLAFNRSDDISFAGVISGVGNLSKQGAGGLLLSANNSYTGTTDVRAGTLTLAGTTSSMGYTIWSGSVLELAVVGGTRVNVANTHFFGQGTLRKTGGGTARWSESKAVFAMSSGGLIDVLAGALIGGSHGNEDWRLNKGDLNVGAGATFDGDEANVRVDALSGAGRIKSGYNGSGYSAFTMGVDNGSGDFYGALENSEATGHFVKEGTGTQILRGVNTFNGSFSVAGGTLKLMGGNNRLNSAVTTYISNGAILDLGGNSQALAALGSASKRVVGELKNGSLTAANGVFLQGGSITARLAGTGSTNLQRLWIGGDANTTVLLNGTNDMVYSTGHQQVMIGHASTGAAGTVKLGNANALAAATESVQVYAGTLDLNGVKAVRARDIGLQSGAASALLNNNTSSGASFLNGIAMSNGGARSRFGGEGLLTLGGVISDLGGLEKVGAGTLVLTAANTYTGQTRVQAGELRLNGSALASAFTVDAGATLSGSGSLKSLVLAGGVSPGNSPGTLSVAGNTSFSEGGSYQWEIADATGLAGLGFDLLNIGGSLSLNASAAQPFTVALKSVLAGGGAGAAQNFDARQHHSYTLAYAAGGILGFDSDEFSINATGFANGLQGGAWSISADHNALTLNFTAAVPEPETYVLFLSGLLAIGGMARRRRGRTADRH